MRACSRALRGLVLDWYRSRSIVRRAPTSMPEGHFLGQDSDLSYCVVGLRHDILRCSCRYVFFIARLSGLLCVMFPLRRLHSCLFPEDPVLARRQRKAWCPPLREGERLRRGEQRNRRRMCLQRVRRTRRARVLEVYGTKHQRGQQPHTNSLHEAQGLCPL